MDYETMPEPENQPEPPKTLPPADGTQVARETMKQIRAEKNGQEMSLEEFQNLTPEDQATAWNAIKADTTQIIDLMTPDGEREDPLLPLVEQLVELNMRLEDKVDAMEQKIQMILDSV